MEISVATNNSMMIVRVSLNESSDEIICFKFWMLQDCTIRFICDKTLKSIKCLPK